MREVEDDGIARRDKEGNVIVPKEILEREGYVVVSKDGEIMSIDSDSVEFLRIAKMFEKEAKEKGITEEEVNRIIDEVRERRMRNESGTRQ